MCGLGPGPADLVTAATSAAIDRVPQRYLRTRRHPSAGVVGVASSFDHLYDTAETVDQVYDGIVESLVAAANQHREVLYAVPGSPIVAESTVDRLRADSRVDVEILPSLSFLDLVWPRLRIDPVDSGVRLVDGHRFETEAAGERGPLLVTQCDHRDVLSSVKLALGELDPAAGDPPTVVVLQRLGLPDEAVAEVAWTELDRKVEPDHLTSLYIRRMAAPVAGELARLDQVIRRLRVECPWDREQTHHTLRRHLLEEAYEVLEAIDHLDVEGGEGYGELEEELGDLLIQVYFHATLAAEQGQFDLADVARVVREKMIGRHPHVFGDVVAGTADDVRTRWDQIKKVEKGRESVMDGIPSALPALLYALKVQKRAASEKVDWRDLLADGDGKHRDGKRADDHKGGSAHDEREPASAGKDPGDEDLGRRLLDLVDEARQAGLDPETELRLAAEHVRDRFKRQYE